MRAIELISRLSEITRHRDRRQVNRGVLTALSATLQAPFASLYRVAHTPEKPLIFSMANLSPGEIEVVDEDDPNHPQSIPTSEYAALLKVLHEKTPLSVEISDVGRHVSVFPMLRGPVLYGLIALQHTAPLSEEAHALASKLIAFYHDHIDLLDYSEKDTLTGLFNRKTFDEYIERLITHTDCGSSDAGVLVNGGERRIRLEEGQDWLAVVDIDHFKRINDNFGHLYGDEVLMRVAQVMQTSFRFYDRIFRFGGEEFVVVLRSASHDDALRSFERLRARIGSHDFPQVGRVTVSIGFSQIVGHDTVSAIIANSDEALYFAKENGRNQVHSHESLVQEGLIAPKEVADANLDEATRDEIDALFG